MGFKPKYMEIKDLAGKTLRVADLNLAILEADDYRNYRRTNPADAKQDAALQAYWQDIYDKLRQSDHKKTRHPATCSFHPQQAVRRVGSPDFQQIKPAIRPARLLKYSLFSLKFLKWP